MRCTPHSSRPKRSYITRTSHSVQQDVWSCSSRAACLSSWYVIILVCVFVFVSLASASFQPTHTHIYDHASTATGRNTNLKSLTASGHVLSPNSLERLGVAIAQQKSSLINLAIGHPQMRDDGTVALCSGLGDGGGGLQEIDLEWKDL